MKRLTRQTRHFRLLHDRVFGFTLIEIVVALAIIGIISTIVVARLNSAKTSSKATNAVRQLKSLEKAINDKYAETGTYANETDLALGANPSMGDLVTAGVLADYFTNVPNAGFGTTGDYLYDNDQVTGGDTNFYTDTTGCDLTAADADGVNIVIAGVFTTGADDIADDIDRLVDRGDGFGCGQVKRNGASGADLIYHISDRYDDVK